MTSITDIMNKKIQEVTDSGHMLCDKGYYKKNCLTNEKPINTENPFVHLLFSIIPLIFTSSERKTISSYEGKHTVERLIHSGYISHGEFILVMMCLGYKMRSSNGLMDSNGCTLRTSKVQFYGQWSKNIDEELKHKFLIKE